MADVSAGKDFLTSLIEWEIKVAAFEVASGDRISEAVRVATIMDHAPDAVKSMLRFSPLEQRCGIDALKLWIRESSCATPGRFQGSMPMQVGAVSEGGKGKKVRANLPETQARAKARARTRTSTRAMTETRTRNATTGIMVSGKRNSKNIVHIARSGTTNARIVELHCLNRKMVQ